MFMHTLFCAPHIAYFCLLYYYIILVRFMSSYVTMKSYFTSNLGSLRWVRDIKDINRLGVSV